MKDNLLTEIWRFLTTSYKIYHLEKTDFSDFWNLWKKNVFRDYKLPRSFSGFIMVLQNLRKSILASTYLLTFPVPIPNKEKKLTSIFVFTLFVVP